MTTPAWPASLNEGFNDGLRITTQDGAVREFPTNGPPLVRQTTDAVVLQYRGDMVFTRAQANTFRNFYHATLAGGTKEFTMEDPMTGQTETFQFMGAPTYRLRSNVDGGAAEPVVVATLNMALLP